MSFIIHNNSLQFPQDMKTNGYATPPFAAQSENATSPEIHSFEWFKENKLSPEYSTGRLSQYEIRWIKTGTGLLTINLNKYPISNHHVYRYTRAD